MYYKYIYATKTIFNKKLLLHNIEFYYEIWLLNYLQCTEESTLLWPMILHGCHWPHRICATIIATTIGVNMLYHRVTPNNVHEFGVLLQSLERNTHTSCITSEVMTICIRYSTMSKIISHEVEKLHITTTRCCITCAHRNSTCMYLLPI